MENIFMAKRLINYGATVQSIFVVNGLVEAVNNKPRFEGSEPIRIGAELIGKTYKELRGLGFRKQPAPSPDDVLAMKPIDHFPDFKFNNIRISG